MIRVVTGRCSMIYSPVYLSYSVVAGGPPDCGVSRVRTGERSARYGGPPVVGAYRRPPEGHHRRHAVWKVRCAVPRSPGRSP